MYAACLLCASRGGATLSLTMLFISLIMMVMFIIIFIIIGIQPLGRSGLRPEFSQATGMALVLCILGKFLLAIFPRFLDVPTFHHNDVRDPSGGSGNCGRECCTVILPK